MFYKGTELQQKAFSEYTDMMRRRLNFDEKLCERIIPKFHVGCRRYVKSHTLDSKLTDHFAQIHTWGWLLRSAGGR